MSDTNQTASVGSSLDDFLHEQGLYDSADEKAIKRVLIFQRVKSELKLAKNTLAKELNGNQPLRA